MAVAGVVLAAGSSTRMGENKLLLPFRGRALVSCAVEAMAGAAVDPACCVLGADADEIRRALEPLPVSRPIQFLLNADHATGRASSVRAAITSLPPGCGAALFLPGDMPLVTSADITAVVRRFERTQAPIVVAVDETGARAHPVLFARPLFARLSALRGDESGHAILRELWDAAEKVPVAARRMVDVDDLEDYRRLLAQEEGDRARVL